MAPTAPYVPAMYMYVQRPGALQLEYDVVQKLARHTDDLTLPTRKLELTKTVK